MRPSPAVGGRAHRAVLARGVDGRTCAVARHHVRRCPAGQGELGVLRAVAGLHDAIAVLGQAATVGGDQDGPERLVARGERRLGQLDAAAQVLEVGFGEFGRAHALRVPPGGAAVAQMRRDR